MKIVYDDMYEFSEIAIRCNDIVRKGKCSYCPFFDRCQVDQPMSRHIQCGEIATVDERRWEETKVITEKFFSPDDVHKMSPKEVSENYQAICNSMKKWR